MDKKFKRIEIEVVKKIICEKGLYRFLLNRVYDSFTGSKYIIVTDNIESAKQNPQYADEIIMTVEQFESYAEIFNAFLANEDRERKRRLRHIEYTEDCDMDLSVFYHDVTHIEETIMADLERSSIHKAMEQLTETQRKRFELFFFYGWTERQIAESENINRYAVRKSLNQAIKKIKKFF